MSHTRGWGKYKTFCAKVRGSIFYKTSTAQNNWNLSFNRLSVFIAKKFNSVSSAHKSHWHTLTAPANINPQLRRPGACNNFYFLFSYRELFFYFSISPFLCAVPRGVWAINLHRVRHALLQLFKRPLHQFRIEIGVLGYRDVLYEEGSQLRSQASG